jgi:site-specific recombinase XerD
LYSITILPKAKEILERYGWSVPKITNQKCNQYLKAIQSACGIKTKLTMHVGRHTFATWALQKGVQIEVVSKMLGHSSINTTQIYAKVLQQSVDAGFDSLA